jgi:putative acetyltransferase
MNLITPTTADEWAEARRLVEEYAHSLGIDLAFQEFHKEIESLPTEYGPPHGGFLLAEHDGRFVGCGGFRMFSADATIAEMKRLYVAPSGRGHGIGRALAVRVIDEARARGYAAIRLDTLPTMHSARAMYAALGFRPIPPYRYNPIEGTTFMELVL